MGWFEVCRVNVYTHDMYIYIYMEYMECLEFFVLRRVWNERLTTVRRESSKIGVLDPFIFRAKQTRTAGFGRDMS